MRLTLCVRCADQRGAFGANAHRYEQKCVGIWRGRCDDCGVQGSSGDATGLGAYHLAIDDAPAPPSTRPELPETD